MSKFRIGSSRWRAFRGTAARQRAAAAGSAAAAMLGVLPLAASPTRPGTGALTPSSTYTQRERGSVDVAEWLRATNATLPALGSDLVALTNVTLPPLDPLILYLSIDSSGDRARRASAETQLARYHSSEVEYVRGIDPLAWPDRGTDRYDEVVALAQKHLLKRKNFEHTDFGHNCSDKQLWSSALWTCPCTVYNVDQLCRSSEGKSLQGGREHHQGCALSHLKAFLTAYERNASSMVVMESDVILPAMWVSGKADHYDTVLKAMIEQAPEDWDMIKLDVGFYEEEWANDGIAKEDRKKPVVQLQIPELEGSKSQRQYVLYKWSGLGLAGSGHHLYSGRFVSKIPKVIKERGLGMVDAWVGGMCADHYLNCYSLVYRYHPG